MISLSIGIWLHVSEWLPWREQNFRREFWTVWEAIYISLKTINWQWEENCQSLSIERFMSLEFTNNHMLGSRIIIIIFIDVF